MSIKKKFYSNLSYALVAQLISMVISIWVNLILPKFLGVVDYSYWQLFIFYSQYMPFLHFGLNDGVYLRYGGIPFDKMNKSIIKSQMLAGFVWQLSFCIILCLGSSLIVDDTNRLMIIIAAGCCFLFFTLQNYLGYIFQAANETSWFSKGIILNRIFFLTIIVIILCQKQYSFWPYVYGYIFAQIVSLFYSAYKAQSILWTKISAFKKTIFEVYKSVLVGGKLMLANIASMLILGVGRFFIDLNWGILTFGKISFSIALAVFLLTFVQQFGMVMFPALRQISLDKQKNIYELIRTGLLLFMPIIFIVFFPFVYLLSNWLPEYSTSFKYLALLLPVCFFDTKMQILFNTYLKVQRKENVLLSINVVALVISLIFCLLGAYVFEDVKIVVVGMVLAIAVRSLIAELYLNKFVDSVRLFNVIQEFIIVYAFIYVAWSKSLIVGFFIMILLYLMFVAINFKKFTEWKNQIYFAS